jgi:hypothetical protein
MWLLLLLVIIVSILVAVLIAARIEAVASVRAAVRVTATELAILVLLLRVSVWRAAVLARAAIARTEVVVSVGAVSASTWSLIAVVFIQAIHTRLATRAVRLVPIWEPVVSVGIVLDRTTRVAALLVAGKWRLSAVLTVAIRGPSRTASPATLIDIHLLAIRSGIGAILVVPLLDWRGAVSFVARTAARVLVASGLVVGWAHAR